MIRIDTIEEFDALKPGPANDLRHLRLIRDGHADSLRKSKQAIKGELSAGSLDEMIDGQKHITAKAQIVEVFFPGVTTVKEARELMFMRAKAIIFLEVCDRIRALEKAEVERLKSA